MRFSELFEGYKEAKIAFSQSSDPDLVKDYLDKFRQLVKQNKAEGDERNIDWWIKKGWEEFQKFVDDTQHKMTTSQMKKQRNRTGKAITLYENSAWLIVVPLDKDASCFYGKGTAWCTTKPFADFYEDYFYNRNITLIYLFNKQSGGKWAIAFHNEVDKVEMFNSDDKSIDETIFQKETGFDPHQVVKKIAPNHEVEIQQSRDEYDDLKKRVQKQLNNEVISNQMENALAKLKSEKLMLDYFSYARGKTSPQLQKLYANMLARRLAAFTPEAADAGFNYEDQYSVQYVMEADFFTEETRKPLTDMLVEKVKDNFYFDLINNIITATDKTNPSIARVKEKLMPSWTTSLEYTPKFIADVLQNDPRYSDETKQKVSEEVTKYLEKVQSNQHESDTQVQLVLKAIVLSTYVHTTEGARRVLDAIKASREREVSVGDSIALFPREVPDEVLDDTWRDYPFLLPRIRSLDFSPEQFDQLVNEGRKQDEYQKTDYEDVVSSVLRRAKVGYYQYTQENLEKLKEIVKAGEIPESILGEIIEKMKLYRDFMPTAGYLVKNYGVKADTDEDQMAEELLRSV